MLNAGALVGAMTGGCGSWLYGACGGMYADDAVRFIDTVVGDLSGLDLKNMLGDLGLLSLTGVLLGACIGTVVLGRSST